MDAARVAGGRGRPVAAGEAARARSQASLGASFAVRAAFIWPALLAILFVSKIKELKYRIKRQKL